MNTNKIILSIVILCFALTSNAQKSIFPKTASAVVVGFYKELGEKPNNISREVHASKVFDKYFSKSYTEITGNKGVVIQNFKEFKAFVTGTLKALPKLDVEIEELVSDGNMVTVKIKLSDKGSGMIVNYLALYYVKDEKIQSRYAYSDGAF
jgi:predicted SnoaL-like aldol condensation-catalyzing enzyme